MLQNIGYNMDTLRQTACMVVNPMLVTLLPLLIAQRSVGPQTNDGTLLNLFQLVDTWLSMSVGGVIVVLFAIFSLREHAYANM